MLLWTLRVLQLLVRMLTYSIHHSIGDDKTHDNGDDTGDFDRYVSILSKLCYLSCGPNISLYSMKQCLMLRVNCGMYVYTHLQSTDKRWNSAMKHTSGWFGISKKSPVGTYITKG